MRKIFYQVCWVCFFECITTNIFSQVTISGPPCAISGIVYEYTINGQWDSTSTMQVCITNGYIEDSSGNNPCTPQINPVNVILVQWNDSASDAGSISVSSSSGNASFTVNFTQPLLPGVIDSPSKMQIINHSLVPGIINCLPDSGGSCHPTYVYQWQQSSDQVIWHDMPGAIKGSLKIDSQLIQNTYYRRKVTETVSGSIGYSDAASVFVVVIPDSTSTDSASGTGFFYLKLDEGNDFIPSHQNKIISIEKVWMLKSDSSKLRPLMMKYNNNA
jgi:hypothetical protein